MNGQVQECAKMVPPTVAGSVNEALMVNKRLASVGDTLRGIRENLVGLPGQANDGKPLEAVPATLVGQLHAALMEAHGLVSEIEDSVAAIQTGLVGPAAALTVAGSGGSLSVGGKSSVSFR